MPINELGGLVGLMVIVSMMVCWYKVGLKLGLSWHLWVPQLLGLWPLMFLFIFGLSPQESRIFSFHKQVNLYSVSIKFL